MTHCDVSRGIPQPFATLRIRVRTVCGALSRCRTSCSWPPRQASRRAQSTGTPLSRRRRPVPAPAGRPARQRSAAARPRPARRKPAVGQTADPHAGLASDQSAGSQVPRVEPALVVGVDDALGGGAQVEGRGAEPPDVAHLRQHPEQHLRLTRAPGGRVPESGGDQGSAPGRSPPSSAAGGRRGRRRSPATAVYVTPERRRVHDARRRPAVDLDPDRHGPVRRGRTGS